MTPYRKFARARHWMDTHPLAGGSASILIFFLAFFIRWALDDVLPPGFPYLTFLPAVVITTFLFGTPAGVLCAALSVLAAWYFFLPPFLSFHLTAQTALALAFFILICTINIYVIDRMLVSLQQREQARENALALASQRDALFKELQHRVGNNLNMIASMLAIQSRALTDEAARHALGEASRRIGLIADINRMFHDPAHADGLLDDAFVQDLGRKALDASGMAERVTFSSDVDALALGQDAFLPLSLVLTECLNNALEHGISNHSEGFIRVVLRVAGAKATLAVENSGNPVPEGFDAARSKSIGLLLVHSFARQLGGTFRIERGALTRSVLEFPVPEIEDQPSAQALAQQVPASLLRPAAGT